MFTGAAQGCVMIIINTIMLILIVIIISFFYTFQVSRYAPLEMQKMRGHACRDDCW